MRGWRSPNFFSRSLYAENEPYNETLRERLRPILMTAIATGAGAASRQSLGTTVFGGMLVATFLSLFVVPILYIVVTYLSESLFGRGQSEYKE